MSDEYEGLPRSFAKLCREADKKQRRKPVDPHLDLLRKLMADDVSFERVWHDLNTAHLHGRAAASTVEALMYSLRERGVKALDEPDTQRRISELSEEQLHEVGGRLQRLLPEIAKPWTADEVRSLLAMWMKCHAPNS
jgi:hypothetical protein